MSALNRNTCRRLKKLPQIPSVWEGDRRPLIALPDGPDSDVETNKECILWVDGSEGIVRAMDVISPEMGPEAVVRALLRAMEHPQSPAKAARPSKIVVRDREIQFYLRGVLQELDIAIDYFPNLPLIDELFRGFEESAQSRQPKLPPEYSTRLLSKAFEIWHDAPWTKLADHQILSIELNCWEVSTLYVSVMGMLGMEYGILLYRSLDSLKHFRAVVAEDGSFESMEKAFLGQDCMFVTYSPIDTDPDDWEGENINLLMLTDEEINPGFGIVHPLEGMRTFLYEEEAIAMYVALEAFQRFYRASSRQLGQDSFPEISKRYHIPRPELTNSNSKIAVKVSTLPEVAAELLAMIPEDEEDEFDEDEFDEDEFDDDDDEMSVPLRDDLIPKDAFLSLAMIPWENIESLRSGVTWYQSKNVPAQGEGMPIILIQTTRPKAKVLIEEIKTAGGLKGICFNPGEDPFQGQRYDLGILQTENSNLYLFGEFPEADRTHVAARKQWDKGCQKNKGFCGLIVAKGVKGASRGNPQPGDMMALFETRSLSAKELGLGVLQLMPEWDFE